MAMTKEQLRDDLYTDSGMASIISALPLSTSEKNALITQTKSSMENMANSIVTHIQDEAEIKNVQISDPAGTVETYIAGAGSNGGSLIAGGTYPVVGSTNKAAQTLNQSNNGTGLIE